MACIIQITAGIYRRTFLQTKIKWSVAVMLVIQSMVKASLPCKVRQNNTYSAVPFISNPIIMHYYLKESFRK